MNHLSASEEFQESASRYDDIIQNTVLETNKQRKGIELAMSVLPNVLSTMPDFDYAFVRDFAYVRG